MRRAAGRAWGPGAGAACRPAILQPAPDGTARGAGASRQCRRRQQRGAAWEQGSSTWEGEAAVQDQVARAEGRDPAGQQAQQGRQAQVWTGAVRPFVGRRHLEAQPRTPPTRRRQARMPAVPPRPGVHSCFRTSLPFNSTTSKLPSPAQKQTHLAVITISSVSTTPFSSVPRSTMPSPYLHGGGSSPQGRAGVRGGEQRGLGSPVDRRLGAERPWRRQAGRAGQAWHPAALVRHPPPPPPAHIHDRIVPWAGPLK